MATIFQTIFSMDFLEWKCMMVSLLTQISPGLNELILNLCDDVLIKDPPIPIPFLVSLLDNSVVMLTCHHKVWCGFSRAVSSKSSSNPHFLCQRQASREFTGWIQAIIALTTQGTLTLCYSDLHGQFNLFFYNTAFKMFVTQPCFPLGNVFCGTDHNSLNYRRSNCDVHVCS